MFGKFLSGDSQPTPTTPLHPSPPLPTYCTRPSSPQPQQTMSMLPAPVIPSSVLAFFAGSGGINVLASPLFLKKHTGKSRVFLPIHDIYHAGKDNGGNAVYTVYRILAKEYKHNTIQGMLCVSLVSGYGVKDDAVSGSSNSTFMRPNDLKKLMTEGTTSIKRNSVVVFKTGMVVRLEDIEIFCDLPIINKRDLIEKQSIGAVCKRDLYKATRGEDNWAHVKQGALLRVMESSVHQLLLPYYRRFRDNSDDSQHFFKAFMEDMIRTCDAHYVNFTESGHFDDLLTDIVQGNKKRSCASLQTETRPRKKWGRKPEVASSSETSVSSTSSAGSTTGTPKKRDLVKATLKNVSREKMASIIF